MKAVFIDCFGSDLDLSLREVADPAVPKGEQVLVSVRAAGLNRADLLQARGLYPPPRGFKYSAGRGVGVGIDGDVDAHADPG